MGKMSKVLGMVIVLLIVVSLGAFAKQTTEKHTVHFAINPFSWIYGVYNGEVGLPLTGLLEVAAQFNYWDGLAMAKLFSDDTDYYTDYYNQRLTVGPVLHVFPAQNATGFFVSARLMYLHFVNVDLGVKSTYNDVSAGVDLGWRYRWQFAKGGGMLLQFYGGVERFFFQGDIGNHLILPIILVGGFHLGFLL